MHSLEGRYVIRIRFRNVEGWNKGLGWGETYEQVAPKLVEGVVEYPANHSRTRPARGLADGLGLPSQGIERCKRRFQDLNGLAVVRYLLSYGLTSLIDSGHRLKGEERPVSLRLKRLEP